MSDEPPSATLSSFLFEELAEDWLKNGSQHTSVVYGGRGYGKTSFLLYVQSRLPARLTRDDGTQRIPVIDGRNIVAAAAALEKYVRTGGNEHLLIDDIDHLERTTDRDLALSIRKNLDLAIQSVKTNRARCLVSATVPLEQTFVEDDALSFQFRQFMGLRLDPWSQGAWEEVFERSLTTAARARPAHGIYLSDEIFSIDKGLRAAWLDQTVILCGGHPALVGGSLAAFQGSIVEAVDAKRLRRDGRDYVPQFLEYSLAQSVLPSIRKRIIELGRSERKDVQDAFAALGQLAVAGDAGMGLSYVASEILQQEGLAYTTNKGHSWRIPGSLIRTEVAREVPTGEAAPGRAHAAPMVTVVEMSAEAEEEGGGLLIAHTAQRKNEVRLPRRQWLLLQALVDHRGEVLPADYLREIIGVKEKPALTSALQHLNRKLQKAGVTVRIQNVWGVGYRFDPEHLEFR